MIDLWLIVGGIVILVLAGSALASLRVSAHPDEWLLVVRDGVPVHAGIGRTVTRRLGDHIAQFTSTVQRVRFEVEVLDCDLLPVRIEAFALWSVDPTDPFLSYRRLGLSDRRGQAHLLSRPQYHAFQQAFCALMVQHAGQWALSDLARDPAPLRDRVRDTATNQLADLGAAVEDLQILSVRPASPEALKQLSAEADEVAQRRVDEAKAETARRAAAARRDQEQLDLEASIEQDARRAEARLAQQHAAATAQQQRLTDGAAAEADRTRVLSAAKADVPPEVRADELERLRIASMAEALGKLPLSDARFVSLGSPLEAVREWIGSA